jgi:predicted Zn-dependent peptidase
MELIKRASPENIRRFYEKRYAPEKMFFVAVGNIDPSKFEECIRHTFQKLRPKVLRSFELISLKLQRKNVSTSQIPIFRKPM